MKIRKTSWCIELTELERKRTGVTLKRFNPSVEGKPLQQSRCRSLDYQWLQEAVFLTYG